jgi:hypothetical protein
MHPRPRPQPSNPRPVALREPTFDAVRGARAGHAWHSQCARRGWLEGRPCLLFDLATGSSFYRGQRRKTRKQVFPETARMPSGAKNPRLPGADSPTRFYGLAESAKRRAPVQGRVRIGLHGPWGRRKSIGHVKKAYESCAATPAHRAKTQTRPSSAPSMSPTHVPPPKPQHSTRQHHGRLRRRSNWPRRFSTRSREERHVMVLGAGGHQRQKRSRAPLVEPGRERASSSPNRSPDRAEALARGTIGGRAVHCRRLGARVCPAWTSSSASTCRTASTFSTGQSSNG